MKRTLILGFLVAAVALCAAPALADHDELSSIYKPAGHTAICMMRCDNGPCTLDFDINDENGNTVASGFFTNVPSNGARMVVYGGPKKLISCNGDPSNGVGDIGWAIVDSTWHTVALANQDDSTN